MSKKRGRMTNPEPFLPFGSDSLSSKKRSKPPKHHQLQQKLVPSAVSSKILKEALLQQKEIQHEEENEDANATNQNPNNGFSFQVQNLKDNDDDDEDNVDDFGGFSETQSQFGQWDFEVCSSLVCFSLALAGFILLLEWLLLVLQVQGVAF